MTKQFLEEQHQQQKKLTSHPNLCAVALGFNWKDKRNEKL